jgi:predicted CXXCH cytochrome family protein
MSEVVKRILKPISILVLVNAFCVAAAWARIHPVPLDPKTDSATCIQCHEDKTKGKAVHSAIQMGCTSCHEVRAHKEVTHVKLTTATPLKLCLSCHADKNAAAIKGVVHPPAVRDCLKCHDPHVAENKNQLLKPTSGGKTDNLCLTCHDIGVKVPKKGSRHAALDMGCDTCHTTHKTGEKGKREFDFHLTKNSPALCLDCHDAKDANLAKAHNNQPFDKADCLSCHDPHQSQEKHLMAKFTHMPFAAGQCDTCHKPAKDGKVVLTAATPKEICVTCHADKAEQIEKAKVQHPGALGDCTDCHNPHAGKTPGFPKPDAVNLCLGCHADQAEMLKTKTVLHKAAFRDGCATCHEPHGGDRPKLLRAEGNTLCTACHSTEIKPQKNEADHVVTIFDGKVRLPENYFDSVTRLQLKSGLGHPTRKHPVSDVVDVLDPKKVTKLSCLTCHQPHSGGARAMLVTDQKPTLMFCRRCHQGMIGAQ